MPDPKNPAVPQQEPQRAPQTPVEAPAPNTPQKEEINPQAGNKDTHGEGCGCA